VPHCQKKAYGIVRFRCFSPHTFQAATPILLSSRREETMYTFRDRGYSTSVLFDLYVGTDIKNSERRVIYFDQASLGIDKEYADKGLQDDEVSAYYTYMKNVSGHSSRDEGGDNSHSTRARETLYPPLLRIMHFSFFLSAQVAVLLGADEENAEEELLKSLQFEMKLAEISASREELRNATKFYHPMTLGEIAEKVAPLVSNWTSYTQRLLTHKVATVGCSAIVPPL